MSYGSFENDPLVIVTTGAGNSSKHFIAHRHQLQASPFFHESLLGQGSDLEMSHYSPETMHHYLHYVYIGQIFRIDYGTLAGLYVLGETAGDAPLRNMIISRFIKQSQCEGSEYRDLEVVQTIFSATDPHSPGRRLMVDTYVRFVPYDHTSGEDLLPEFKNDLLEQLMVASKTKRGLRHEEVFAPLEAANYHELEGEDIEENAGVSESLGMGECADIEEDVEMNVGEAMPMSGIGEPADLPNEGIVAPAVEDEDTMRQEEQEAQALPAQYDIELGPDFERWTLARDRCEKRLQKRKLLKNRSPTPNDTFASPSEPFKSQAEMTPLERMEQDRRAKKEHARFQTMLSSFLTPDFMSATTPVAKSRRPAPLSSPAYSPPLNTIRDSQKQESEASKYQMYIISSIH